MKIKANLVAGKITSNSVESQNLFSTQNFGEKVQDKIFYSLAEAFYLVKLGKMDIYTFQNKKLIHKELEKKLEKLDKKFNNKYLVFRDLRKKGYVVKSALKFGAEFRVYEKGKKPGKAHAKWLCFPVSENKSFTWQDFTAKNRVAHSTKKNLLIAVVDEECSISYFEIKWSRP